MSSRRRLSRSRGARPSSPVLAGGMARTLGIRLVALTKKRVRAEMPVKPLHLNRSGRVNGGAIMAFADALGATGTVANLPPGHRTTTLESKTNFFAAGEGPLLTAVAVPLHIGRMTMVWQTTVKNGNGRTVAIVTQTQMVIPEAPPAQRVRKKA
ncbi:MAG: PaaI family thioesterase [Betaproteobacteria bacterium]|nr:PaaI family thioesterase [Betaproteobacteria bacterium]